MCILFLFGFQYLFPLQARYRNTIRNTWKNAWLLSIAALPWTLLSIALVIAAIYVSFFMNPNAVNLAVFLWGTLGFGIVAYTNSCFFQKAFQMIDPEKLEAKHEAPKEAIFTDEEHRTSDNFYQESSFSNPDWNRQDHTGGKSF
jgi:amino acid permease